MAVSRMLNKMIIVMFGFFSQMKPVYNNQSQSEPLYDRFQIAYRCLYDGTRNTLLQGATDVLMIILNE